MLADPRLHHVFTYEPATCATITEYAQACGLPPERIIDLMNDALDAGILTLEPVGGEIFVHTSPTASNYTRTAAAKPNLWAQLRETTNPAGAYLLWRLVRSLQQGGWTVETSQAHIKAGLGPLNPTPALALAVNNTLAPAILHPDSDTLRHQQGPAAALADAGATIVAVIIDSGGLDEAVTAIHHLGTTRPDITTVYLLCEEPSYHPVAVTCTDAAVLGRGKITGHIPIPDTP